MSLSPFFSPSSVAVIGASRNPSKVGHVVFRNLVEGEFKGKVYPVNPNIEELFGRKSHPNAYSIGEAVDLAVIAVPAELTPKVLEDCGKANIKNVIVLAGGFKEVGNERLEEKVAEIIKKHKMQALGVNCIGVLDPYTGMDTIFLPRYKLERPSKGEIAFVTQSGAVGTVIIDWMAMKNYKLSKFVSYGNATALDESDWLAYLGGDRPTKAICIYIEGVRDGRKFFDALKKVSKQKPVIVLKGGTTEEGNRATQSHTGSLAGSAEIFHAAVKQAGGVSAATNEELFDFARILTTQQKPRGRRIQVVTNGGGYGVLMVDGITNNKLVLAEMSPPRAKKLKKTFPPHVVVKNPIDLTGDVSAEDYRIAIEEAIHDPKIDIVVAIVLLQTPRLTGEIVEVLTEAKSQGKKPLVVVSAGGRYTEVLKKSMEDAGVPTFSQPTEAAAALKVLCDYYNV